MNQNSTPPAQPDQSVAEISPADSATTQQSTPIPTIPPAEKGGVKSKNGILLILITLLVLVGLGAMGFWAYQNYFPASQFTDDVSPTPVVTSDPTTNWKTYTNLKYGFTIKHPDDFKIDESLQQIVLYKGEKVNSSGATDPYGNTVSITFEFKSFQTDPNEACLDTGSFMGQCAFFTNTDQAFQQNNITINNTSGIKVQADGYEDTRTFYYLKGPNGGRVVTISLWNDNENKFKEDMQLLQQILSTFRVIDQEAPASWKTYKGDHFSFKYPAEFYLHEDVIMKTVAVHTQDFSMPPADDSRRLPLWIQTWEKTDNKTLKDFIKDNHIDTLFIEPIVNVYSLDSLPGYHYEGVEDPYFVGKDADRSRLVMVEDSANIYTISNNFITDKFTLEIFNQILSTFKFSK